MIKGYKIRIYPTKEQEILLNKHIDCCRFMWNYMLSIQQMRHKNGESNLSAFSMCKLIPDLKQQKEYMWLKEVANSSLQSVCRDLDATFKNFFNKKCSFPNYKNKKHSKRTYPIRSDDRIYFRDENFITIPKIKRLKYKTDLNFKFGIGKEKLLNPRISFVDNKWFLSFAINYENQVINDKNIESIGIDLGIKETAVVYYDGNFRKYHNINKSTKMKNLEKQLKRYQRIAARKYSYNKKHNIKNGNNYKKVNQKIAKIYKRMYNIRMNYIHQTTHEIISLNPKKIVMEDLALENMVKNKHLSKAIKDQKLYDFIQKMKYKSEWNGTEFIQVSRFYPSSKKCSCCGNVKNNLRLKDRIYKCDCCGFIIERDFNAAINLAKYIV